LRQRVHAVTASSGSPGFDQGDCRFDPAQRGQDPVQAGFAVGVYPHQQPGHFDRGAQPIHPVGGDVFEPSRRRRSDLKVGRIGIGIGEGIGAGVGELGGVGAVVEAIECLG
jgi:hypothetical protein